jgi:hypothetical protein
MKAIGKTGINFYLTEDELFVIVRDTQRLRMPQRRASKAQVII